MKEDEVNKLNEDQLDILDDRKTAIMKLPVFFGSYDNFYHPIREVVVNARDVLKDTENAIIKVTLHDDCQTVTVEDNGRGLPILGETKGIPNWKVLFLTLFGGSKMSAGDNDTGGTNGCGNTIICYSSDFMEATVRKNGKIYHISFKNSGELDKEFRCIGETNETGTIISFKLSKDIYTNTVFDPKVVEDIIEKIVATSPNITSYFTHKEYTSVFNYSSLLEYSDKHMNNKMLDDIVIAPKKYQNEFLDKESKEIKTEETTIELILNACEDNLQESFLNGIYLPEYGKIQEGIFDGLRNVLHSFIQENGLYEKKEKTISRQDVADTISFICKVTSTNVSYSNQTKFKTEKELYQTLIISYIKSFFEFYKMEHKNNMLRLADRVLLTKRTNERAEINRSKIKKELEEKVTSASNRPSKFIPCRSKDPNEVELILIEGESAKNCISNSRNSKFMSVYPLKGKPMNVLKHDIDKIMANTEIRDIFKILGCGITYKGKNVKGMPAFNIDNLLVDKVLITTDRDVDGCHIESLLIGIFYTLAPELLKQGKIYVLYTPLYVIKTKTEEIYAYTEEERNTIIKNLGCKFTEVRYKGLGGLSSQVMSKTAMDINNRKIKQIVWTDIEQGLKMLKLCLSDEKENSRERKEYIESNGHKFFDYSLLEG